MFDYELEHILSYAVTLNPPEVIGPVPEGIRVNFYVTIGEDAYERFLRGEGGGIVPLRVVPRFLTADPDYQWLNRLQCMGIGEVNLESLEVGYDVYALR